MTNQPLHHPYVEQPRRFYAELSALKELQQAYAHIQEKSGELGIDPLTIETIEASGVGAFLQQLSDDLQAQTYHPSQAAEGEGRVSLRDLVVQVALKHLLESAFPPAFASDPDPEKTIKWLTGNIDKELCRVYAVNLDESLDAGEHERLVERVNRRIGDPQLIALLKEILAASQPPQGLLAPLLADIAFEGIDRILQQAKALGREENCLHVQCTRVANELVALFDRDPRYDWIMPAVKKRLREELSNLHYDPGAIDTQVLDLTCGEPLRFLDFELRLVKDRHGDLRAEYRRVEESDRRNIAKVSARRRPLGRYHPLRFVQLCLNWLGHEKSWQIVEDSYLKVNSIELGWRHLPITLYPVLALVVGWQSPLTWLCLALILLGNWRSLPAVYAFTREHWLDTTAMACAIALLISLWPLASDLYAHLSRETAVPYLPEGFYLGQYSVAWDREPAAYGLYVSPHLRQEKGPFPLIVFLHGYGERSKDRLFSSGLPQSIFRHFGEHNQDSPFPFIAFFPIDPTGQWQVKSDEVAAIMKTLDYVIRRHRIDPARVYLTGHSSGGSGVWALAEAYPNKWAAVAPISSFIDPDIAKVRHIPAWIFHGAKDPSAPVERERALVKKLQEADAEVRYTEGLNNGHLMWREAYNNKAFYEWLMAHVRK